MSSDGLCWQEVSPQKRLILSRRLVTPRKWNTSKSRGSSSFVFSSNSSLHSPFTKRESRRVAPHMIPPQLPDNFQSLRSDSDLGLGSSISKTFCDSRPPTSRSAQPFVSTPAIFVIEHGQPPETGVTSGVTSGHDTRRWSDNFTNTSSSWCPNCSQGFQHSLLGTLEGLEYRSDRSQHPDKIEATQSKYLVRNSSKSVRTLRGKSSGMKGVSEALGNIYVDNLTFSEASEFLYRIELDSCFRPSSRL